MKADKKAFCNPAKPIIFIIFINHRISLDLHVSRFCLYTCLHCMFCNSHVPVTYFFFYMMKSPSLLFFLYPMRSCRSDMEVYDNTIACYIYIIGMGFIFLNNFFKVYLCWTQSPFIYILQFGLLLCVCCLGVFSTRGIIYSSYFNFIISFYSN